MKKDRKIGIIGVGPRGGYALENFIIELNRKNILSQIHMLLFEETGYFGNGQVYDINQVKTNWINITERALRLEKRLEIKCEAIHIPSFPSYHEWTNKDYDTLPKTTEDTFPPRGEVGKYLAERFQTLVNPLLEANIVSLFNERVENVKMISNHKMVLTTNENTYEDVDEILLTIGHQPTELSKQLIEWDKFVADNPKSTLFKSPYPIANFLTSENLTTESSIGIRGFGLAMIDVARAIAEKFGKFVIEDEATKLCSYQTTHEIKKMLIPFSLDGLPPAPKPLNAKIDEWFAPTDAQISTFEDLIKDTQTQKEAESPQFLISAFAPIAAKIYRSLPKNNLNGKLSLSQIEELIHLYLQNEVFEHTIITPVNQSAEKTMQDFVGMATGKEAVSLDYCIGQVWRHCQPSIYEKLSFNECSEEVFAEIIALDERLKRYSYGPPVESIQQLLALLETEVLTLKMVNNPEFELTKDGWLLKTENKSITANMMINSVLDAPKIKAVSSPIVKQMLTNDLLEVVHDDLGVSTDENGYIIPETKNHEIPVALLGRLAKGTVIGVDAILECFGIRGKKWASEAANRHEKWLSKK